jgi:hypothetical protein
MNNSPLNNVITDPRVRRIIYGTYTVVAFIAAAITVGFASTPGGIPQWDVTLNTVLGFIGAGVGGLAVANTNTSPAAVQDAVAPTIGIDPDEEIIEEREVY